MLSPPAGTVTVDGTVGLAIGVRQRHTAPPPAGAVPVKRPIVPEDVPHPPMTVVGVR